MAEVNQRGPVVKINELEDMMEISFFFPILYNSQKGIEGYFIKKIDLYDYEKDGKLDGLNEQDRKKLRNIIKASKIVLEKHNRKNK